MELLIHTVTEHLGHNKRIVVPRLGTFILKPDGETIVFSELLRSDDGVLRALLTDKGLGELEIDGMIDRLIFNIRHAVSNSKDYTIDGFGTFTAGANSTIRFTQGKPQRFVQGYIKPSIPQSDKADRRYDKSSITAVQDKTVEHTMKMSRSHIANPDPYLRGLKYDKHKNSVREGTVYVMSDVKHSRRRNMLIALIAAIAVICTSGYIFVCVHNNQPEQEIIFADDVSTEMIDTASDTEISAEHDEAALQSETEQKEDNTTLSAANSGKNR